MLRHFFSGILTPVQETFGFSSKMSDARFGEIKDEMLIGAEEIDAAAQAVIENPTSEVLDDLLIEFYAVTDVNTMRVHNKFLAQCVAGDMAVDVAQAVEIENFYRDTIDAVYRVKEAVVGQEVYQIMRDKYEGMSKRALEKLDQKMSKIPGNVMAVCLEDYKSLPGRTPVAQGQDVGTSPEI